MSSQFISHYIDIPLTLRWSNMVGNAHFENANDEIEGENYAFHIHLNMRAKHSRIFVFMFLCHVL